MTRLLGYSLISGLLLASAWPVNGITPLIFVSLIPLLFVEDILSKDNLGKKIASKFGKFFRKHLLNDNHPDTGCGIKVFHKKLYLLLPYFDHMHRFFPALATREGALVLQHDVNHRPRSKGSSNYTNLGRLFVSIFDIIGMIWLLKRYPKNLKINEIKK